MGNNYYNIPHELRQLRQWCVWKYVAVYPSNSMTKVPFHPNGTKCSTVDPDTWATFEEVIAAVEKFDGIGFIFTRFDPYAGIDLDKIMEKSPEIQALFEKIFKNFNSYTEWSPSGTGLHIIIKAAIPQGVNNRQLGCEMYSEGRFFTMTGNSIDARPIEYRQEMAEILYGDLIGSRVSKASIINEGAVLASRPQEKEDAEVYDAALRAHNGDLFCDLWAGQWKERGYPSQSEADFALINIIQFYSHNVEQVIRIFLLSGLGQREKARKRPDYVKRMAIRAFDNEQHLIDFSELDNRKKVEEEKKITTDFAPKIDPVSSHVFTKPTGLLGEIAEFIYQSSPRPVAEASLSAAIIMMAGIAGKAFNISNTGLNHYILYLATSGTGKEAIASGVSRLMNEASYRIPPITSFKGPADFASGQGLARIISESDTKGCMFSIVGEFGLRMQQMASQLAHTTDTELQRCLLNLYTKSGRFDVYDGKAYSSKENNIKSITAPAFSLLGEGVPTSFYSMIDEKTVLSGLLPRFTIIEYNGPRVPNNKFHASAKPTEELLSKLSDLAAICLGNIKRNIVYDIPLDYEAAAIDEDFDKYCDRMVNESTKEVMKYTYSRTRVKVLKLAGLLAVGNNYISPVVTADDYEWAKKLIVHETEALMKKFENGKLVNNLENLEQEQLIAVMRQLQYWWQRSDLNIKSGRTTIDMQKDGIYVVSDLTIRMSQLAVFRRDQRVDMAKKINRAVESIKSLGFCAEVNWAHPQLKARGHKCAARSIVVIDYNGMCNYLANMNVQD